MNVTIRRMTQADISDVQAVARTSWQATYARIIPLDVQKTFLQQAYSINALHHRIEHTHFFIADVSEKVVGFANFSHPDLYGQVELGAIYLLPAVLGKGIGSKLLETGLTEIDGIKEVLVHVEKHNQRAIQFYEKMGFLLVKEIKESFYGQPLQSFQYILFC